MPPLLVNGDITHFSEKADLLNKFFGNQFTPLNNSDKLPRLYLKTNKFCNLSINENDISTIISNLDLMDGIIYWLEFIHYNVSLKEHFKKKKEKKKWYLFIKKESKCLIKNYRPRRLLPILGKIFERVIYKDLFNYFYCNNLFAKN